MHAPRWWKRSSLQLVVIIGDSSHLVREGSPQQPVNNIATNIILFFVVTNLTGNNMAHLHELLAAEKTVTSARDRLFEDTENKFSKGDSFFAGFTKTLKLLEESADSEAIQDAARQDKELPTTVVTTMDYFLGYWAKAETLLQQKNVTNTTAVADLSYQGQVIAKRLPVDELMGLEVRLIDLRKLTLKMPTLDASKSWKLDASAAQDGTWRAVNPQVTTKTEKIEVPVILAQATDKHPAQVKVSTSDKVIGTFTMNTTSGATTAIQKANLLAVLDELIVEVKAARTRANSVTVSDGIDPIGKTIKAILMAPLLAAPVNNQV